LDPSDQAGNVTPNKQRRRLRCRARPLLRLRRQLLRSSVELATAPWGMVRGEQWGGVTDVDLVEAFGVCVVTIDRA